MIRRVQKLYTVVTFPTTASALRMEQIAPGHGFSGRLIPVPRALSTGCGLAWREENHVMERLRDFLENEQIPYTDLQMMIL